MFEISGMWKYLITDPIQRKKEERRREQEMWEEAIDQFFREMLDDILRETEAAMRMAERRHVVNNRVVQAFRYFGLNYQTDSIESVKGAFRRIALKCHPDHGGSSAEFNKAVRYRDICIDHIVKRP